MKKLTSLFLAAALLLLAVLFVSCGGKSPSQVLTEELEALRKGEASASDGEMLTDADMEMQKIIYENMRYTVGEEKISGSTAAVAVEITVIDIKTVFSQYLAEAFTHAADENWDPDGEAMLGMMASPDAPTVTKNVTVNMVKTDGEWVIDENGNDDFLDAISGGLLSYLSGLGGLLGE